MQRIFALCFFIFVARIAAAEWQVIRAADEPLSAATLVYRRVDLEEAQTGNHAVVDLALFSTKSCKLRVIDNPDASSNLSAAMRRADCLAAVNGGYFDSNFAPLGLRIIDRKITSRLTRGRLLTGVIASDNATQISVSENFLHVKNGTPRSNVDLFLSISRARFSVSKRPGPRVGPSPRLGLMTGPLWAILPVRRWLLSQKF